MYETLKSSLPISKILELCFLGLIVVLLIYNLSCKSAEENLTAKNIDCSKLSQENSLTCCLQFMSVKSGNDSKDVFCDALKDELAESFREARKMKQLEYCKEQNIDNIQQTELCWAKLNTK